MPRRSKWLGAGPARNCVCAAIDPEWSYIAPFRTFALASRPAILPDMPIVGSDGGLVGIVHRVSGIRIVVARDGVAEVDLPHIPVARVAAVTDRVTLDCPADRAFPRGDDQGAGRRWRAIGRYVWGAVGIGAVALIVAGGVMLARRSHGPKAGSAAVAPPPAPIPAAGRRDAVAPVAPSTPTAPGGVAVASAPALAAFLNSDAPAPHRFAFDGTGFGAGPDRLSAEAARTIDDIARVLGDHLNTRIKLAVVPGGGAAAQRRVAAIRAALIDRGVAPYRIATGLAGGKAAASRSGVEIVVLAK